MASFMVTVLALTLLGFLCLTSHGSKFSREQEDDIEEIKDMVVKLLEDRERKRYVADDKVRESLFLGQEMLRKFNENQKINKLESIKRGAKDKKHQRIKQQKVTRDLLQKQQSAVQMTAAKKALVDLTGLPIREIAEDQIYSGSWYSLTSALKRTNHRRKRSQSSDTSVCDIPDDPAFDCNTLPDVDKYRTINGMCNNKTNFLLGAAGTTQRRFLREIFNDSISEPRASVNPQGAPLPSPRKISSDVFAALSDNTPDAGYNTIMSMNWGQFIDHDITLTPEYPGDFECCPADTADSPQCLPITFASDPELNNANCMDFVRSLPVDPCALTGKQVSNSITTFIDASNVYGSSVAETAALRDGVYLKNITGLLPEDSSSDAVCDIQNTDESYCCLCGDGRCNVQPGLTLLHNLFVLVHNDIVDKLIGVRQNEFATNPEAIFNEARKIVGAFMQQITFREYFENLFNEDTVRQYDLGLVASGNSDPYDPSIDPSIRVAFSTAAFRFGHSQVQKFLGYKGSEIGSTETNVANLEETFLDPYLLVKDGGQFRDNLTYYSISHPAKVTDAQFSDPIRNNLFRHNLDLVSLNIQRGRDHGLPSYTAWREFCNLTVPAPDDHQNWDAFSEEIRRQKRNKLQAVYTGGVHDVDLYAGGMSETSLVSSYGGPTFNCIMAKQFEYLKKGDRFWYERPEPEGFSPDKLTEIRKVSLAMLFCQHFNIESIQANPLRSANRRSCSDQILRPRNLMSFEPWREATP